jgi:hypothetical protein
VVVNAVHGGVRAELPVGQAGKLGVETSAMIGGSRQRIRQLLLLLMQVPTISSLIRIDRSRFLHGPALVVVVVESHEWARPSVALTQSAEVAPEVHDPAS